MRAQTVDVRPNGGFVGVIVVIRRSPTPIAGVVAMERELMMCQKGANPARHPVVGAIGLPQKRRTMLRADRYRFCVRHQRGYELPDG